MEKELFEFSSDQGRYAADEYDWKDKQKDDLWNLAKEMQKVLKGVDAVSSQYLFRFFFFCYWS